MVANAAEGASIVESMARRPQDKRLSVFAHWGITGGNFFEAIGEDLSKVQLQVLQTYSFIDAKRTKAKAVIEHYLSTFKVNNLHEIFAPVGTAHAYDLIHVLALAIDKAGTIERPEVRLALEQIESYSGLIRDYQPPFSPTRHEGLDASDYSLATYDFSGTIIPVK